MIPIESYKAYVLYTTHLHGIYCVNAQYHCKTVYGNQLSKHQWVNFTGKALLLKLQLLLHYRLSFDDTMHPGK